MTEKRHCSQCDGNYDLVPPADTAYSVPRLKPITDDNIMMVYSCDHIGCQNRIYWEKPVNIVSRGYRTEALRNRQKKGRKAEGVQPFD